MNTCQNLLQKGIPNCTNLEKAADVILLFPRLMWLGRDIKVKTEGERPEIIDEEGLSISNLLKIKFHNEVSPMALLLLRLVYISGSFLATPCLGIGLTCKKIALSNDSRANYYHKVIEVASEEVKLARKKEKLKKKQDEIQKKIEDIDICLKQLIVSKDSTDYVKNLVQNHHTSFDLEKIALQYENSEITIQLENVEKQLNPLHEKVERAFKILKNMSA